MELYECSFSFHSLNVQLIALTLKHNFQFISPHVAFSITVFIFLCLLLRARRTLFRRIFYAILLDYSNERKYGNAESSNSFKSFEHSNFYYVRCWLELWKAGSLNTFSSLWLSKFMKKILLFKFDKRLSRVCKGKESRTCGFSMVERQQRANKTELIIYGIWCQMKKNLISPCDMKNTV